MELLEAEKCIGADLQEKRLERAEVLASWKQGEPYQAFTLGVGECWSMMMETAEDVLRGLESMKVDEGDKEMVGRMKTTLRKLHRRAQEQFCRAAVANKHGFQAVNRIFEQPTGWRD
jgi:hypothetical protein